MGFIRKLPLLSFTLLLVSYFNFGWVLSEAGAEWWVWLISTLAILLMAEALAAPWSIIRTVSVQWLKSDFRAFFTVMMAAFLFVLFLSTLHISAHGLILFVAASIARLDLQKGGNFQAWQDFVILAVVAICGLILGWGSYHLMPLH